MKMMIVRWWNLTVVTRTISSDIKSKIYFWG